MQLIFPGLPLGAINPMSLHPRFYEFFQREEVRHLVLFFVAVLVGSQLFHIVALWVASKAVMEKSDSTFGNAAKVWLFGILLGNGILAVLAIGIALEMHSPPGLNPLHLILALGGALVLWVILVFLIPMKVYDTGLGRAALILFLAGFINGSVTTVVKTVLTPALHMEKDVAKVKDAVGQTSDERGKFMIRLFGLKTPDEVDQLLEDGLHPIGPRPSLAEEEAMVRTLQQKLTAKQQSLPLGDVKANNVYQNELKRYLQFRNEVLARSKPT